MKVLIGCEESQVVTAEFIELGHDAWSCDKYYPGRKGLPHYQCDIREVLHLGWDLAIFHTPCTYLSNSGVKHLYIDGKLENGRFEPRWELMRQDAQLFLDCLNAPIPMIAMENPIMHRHAAAIIGRKYDQIIQPWQFGHPESKQTCFWLKNLPKLRPTNVLTRPESGHWENQTPSGQNKLSPGPERARLRSETYKGVAEAMADQWGGMWCYLSPLSNAVSCTASCSLCRSGAWLE